MQWLELRVSGVSWDWMPLGWRSTYREADTGLGGWEQKYLLRKSAGVHKEVGPWWHWRVIQASEVERSLHKVRLEHSLCNWVPRLCSHITWEESGKITFQLSCHSLTYQIHLVDLSWVLSPGSPLQSCGSPFSVWLTVSEDIWSPQCGEGCIWHLVSGDSQALHRAPPPTEYPVPVPAVERPVMCIWLYHFPT